MDYGLIFLALVAGYFVFKVASSLIKFAFTAAFVFFGVMMMSSLTGLL